MTRINVNNLLAKTGDKLLSDEQKKINRRIASQKYYLKNKQKIKKKQAEYRLTIKKEKLAEYQRNYYKLNRDKINERHRKYKRKNKNKIRLYRQKNKDKINAQTRNRYNKNKIIKKEKKTKKKIIKKVDKALLAKKDSELLKYYINNVWSSSLV